MNNTNTGTVAKAYIMWRIDVSMMIFQNQS